MAFLACAKEEGLLSFSMGKIQGLPTPHALPFRADVLLAPVLEWHKLTCEHRDLGLGKRFTAGRRPSILATS